MTPSERRVGPSPDGPGEEPPRAYREERAALRALLLLLVWLVELCVPKSDLVLIRTFPDFDDQGREFLRAWRRVHPDARVVWLVEGDPSVVPPDVRELGVTCLSASSHAGWWAYLRSSLVVHTRGLYGVPRRSRAKCFVNLWHGMPVKRLYVNSAVAKRQTDLLTVTSEVHRTNLGDTWGIPRDRIVVEGLPRGDRLVRARSEPVPDALAAEAGGRRLCLWLPTYRTASWAREHRDGRDFGNVFQLPGATIDGIAEMFRANGLHVVVKTHPIAPRQQAISLPGLTVWNEDDLTVRGLTLYQALGHAELLLTDYSSVWIDYLLLGRPIVFTIGDRDEYSESRGYYFTPLEDYLPGPVVETLDGLRTVLSTPIDDLCETWGPSLASSRALHHEFADGASAERVVATVSSRCTRSERGSREKTRTTGLLDRSPHEEVS